MIVIADTSPIRYLGVIGRIDLLHQLYSRIVLPSAVYQELAQLRAPAEVRSWLDTRPPWIEVAAPHQGSTENIDRLDPGEFEAIQMALQQQDSLLLIDEAKGRASAHRQGIRIVGTVGILEEASRRGLLDFFAALDDLDATNFRLAANQREALIKRMLAFLENRPAE